MHNKLLLAGLLSTSMLFGCSMQPLTPEETATISSVGIAIVVNRVAMDSQEEVLDALYKTREILAVNGEAPKDSLVMLIVDQIDILGLSDVDTVAAKTLAVLALNRVSIPDIPYADQVLIDLDLIINILEGNTNG